MDAKTIERRAEQARALLADEIYKEAYTAIETRLINLMSNADTAPETGEKLRMLLVAHRKIKQYMEQVVMSGAIAAQEIERQQTMTERIRDRAAAAMRGR